MGVGVLTHLATQRCTVGNHGVWPFADYLLLDDVTEVWWDTSAQGPDELDNQGIGMYRYVDGGRRYLPGGNPRSDPKVFNPAGSVMLYNERPAQDGRVPAYDHQHYR